MDLGFWFWHFFAWGLTDTPTEIRKSPTLRSKRKHHACCLLFAFGSGLLHRPTLTLAYSTDRHRMATTRSSSRGGAGANSSSGIPRLFLLTAVAPALLAILLGAFSFLTAPSYPVPAKGSAVLITGTSTGPCDHMIWSRVDRATKESPVASPSASRPRPNKRNYHDHSPHQINTRHWTSRCRRVGQRVPGGGGSPKAAGRRPACGRVRAGEGWVWVWVQRDGLARRFSRRQVRHIHILHRPN